MLMASLNTDYRASQKHLREEMKTLQGELHEGN